MNAMEIKSILGDVLCAVPALQEISWRGYTEKQPQVNIYTDDVNLYLRVESRPCNGGECDLGSLCERHTHTSEIAQRYQRRMYNRRGLK